VRSFWLISVVCLAAGCSTSRWAMDDLDYRAKYSRPYGDDKIPRMAKQAIDARHVAGKGGFYGQVSGQSSPFNLGGEIGREEYLTSCFSARAGLMGLLSTNAEGCAFLGGNVGARIQTPTRLAPFAGVGAFAGVAEWWATTYTIVDDVEITVESEETHGLAGLYPEVGAHFWLNGKTRVSLSGSYLVTTEGRDEDFWFYGLTVASLGP